MGRWQEVVGVGREVVGEGGARCDEEARGLLQLHREFYKGK
jgi:hypothetical protein